MMRFEVRFSCDDKITIPVHYNEYVQAIVYNHLDPKLSTKLHNEGFKYNKRKFKFFTFSRILGKSSFNSKTKTLTFVPPISIFFSFSVRDIAKSFLDCITKANGVKLKGNVLKVISVRIYPIKSYKSVKVKTLSPITVYRTFVEDGKRKTRYYSPNEAEFSHLVKDNLLRKYRTLFGRDYSGEFNIEVVKVGRMAIVNYKGTFIKAWDGVFTLEGDEDMLFLALSSGLGAKNSQGFGMIMEI